MPDFYISISSSLALLLLTYVLYKLWRGSVMTAAVTIILMILVFTNLGFSIAFLALENSNALETVQIIDGVCSR
jgi:hypothetical protein